MGAAREFLAVLQLVRPVPRAARRSGAAARDDANRSRIFPSCSMRCFELRNRPSRERAPSSNARRFRSTTARTTRRRKSSLLQATDERPDDATAWLELEVLAGRSNDPELRVQALEARCQGSKKIPPGAPSCSSRSPSCSPSKATSTRRSRCSKRRCSSMARRVPRDPGAREIGSRATADKKLRWRMRSKPRPSS